MMVYIVQSPHTSLRATPQLLLNTSTSTLHHSSTPTQHHLTGTSQLGNTSTPTSHQPPGTSQLGNTSTPTPHHPQGTSKLTDQSQHIWTNQLSETSQVGNSSGTATTISPYHKNNATPEQSPDHSARNQITATLKPKGNNQLERRFPQCIIIGARKAGTRALLRFMNLHPAIVAAKREMHFFEQERKFQLGYAWYRQQMPYSYPWQLTIEKTPAYFHHVVAEKIHHFNSSIRLILIVRDPVKRAISDYLQTCLKVHAEVNECPTFEHLALRPDGSVNSSYPAVNRSLYYEYLLKWHRYFSPKQIHIVHGDLFTKDPISELYKIETFLNLRHSFKKSSFFYNATKGFFCYNITSNYSKCLGKGKGRPHPHQPEEVLQKLRRFYYTPNIKLFEHTKIKFGWNDQVGMQTSY